MLSESASLISSKGELAEYNSIQTRQDAKRDLSLTTPSHMDLQNNNHILAINGDLIRSGDGSPSSPSTLMGNHNGDPGQQSGAPTISVILTIRLLMQGKEVGSIIGKRGDHIKIIRDESNAKINISDGSCPERIVTITGNVDTIHKAFTMICRKFEDDMQQLPNSVPKPPITFRLIVPATQCGSLIGKGGSKIKEIREATGASIQVASEMLPNSTERAVTISGTAESIIVCMHQICQILLESPPKGATIPYRPKPTINPLLLATSAAAAAAAQQPCSTAILPPSTLCQFSPELTKIHPLNQLLPGFNPTVLAGNPYSAAPGVIPLSVTAANQSALFSPELALATGAFGTSAAAKTGESYTSYAANSMGRSDLDLQSKSQNEAAAAAALSQYVINSSPTRAAAAVAANAGAESNGGASTSASSTSTFSVSQTAYQQQRKATGAAATTSTSTAAAMPLANPALAAVAAAASMASIAGHNLHKGLGSADVQARQQQHQHQQHLNALQAAAAAALAGGAVRPAPMGGQQRKPQQASTATMQSGFQLPFMQYSPTTDTSSSGDVRSSAASGAALTAAAAAQQQATAAAYFSMLNGAGLQQVPGFGFNSALGAAGAQSPLALLPWAGTAASGPTALMLAAGAAPGVPAHPALLYPMGQQQSQLLALQHAAAAASVPGAAGGPIIGCLGEKLAKRFTPY